MLLKSKCVATVHKKHNKDVTMEEYHHQGNHHPPPPHRVPNKPWTGSVLVYTVHRFSFKHTGQGGVGQRRRRKGGANTPRLIASVARAAHKSSWESWRSFGWMNRILSPDWSTEANQRQAWCVWVFYLLCVPALSGRIKHILNTTVPMSLCSDMMLHLMQLGYKTPELRIVLFWTCVHLKWT